jgi:hypothetical protein
LIERAARRIQKIIQVTNTTAAIERKPPMASCALKLSWVDVYVSSAPKARLRATAAATPAHTAGRAARRPVFTRYATRMLTTSEASSPSRRPIRKTGSTRFSSA